MQFRQIFKIFLEKAAGFNANATTNSIDSTIQQMIDELKKVDNQLASKLIKHKNEQVVFFNKLKKEINEKLKEKSEQDLAKVTKIKETLFPNGTPQERFENILQYSTDLKMIDEVYSEIRFEKSFGVLGI